MTTERVLVVDDNAINLELISFLLEADGFEVTTAGTAEQALESLRTLAPQLIIVDIQLPGMSGLELVARVRCLPEHANTCIVAVTSYAMAADKASAFAAGCDGYLSKPVETRAFADQVRAISRSLAKRSA